MSLLSKMSKDTCHYVALHPCASHVPRLSCTPVLALDISKHTIEAYDGKKVRKVGRALAGVLLTLRPQKVYLESTGVYHRSVVQMFLDNNIAVFEVNARKFKQYRQQLYEDVKTDRLDCEAMWKFAQLFDCRRLQSVGSDVEPLLRKRKMLSDCVRKWRVFLESARENKEGQNVLFFKEQIKNFEREKRLIDKELSEGLPSELVDRFGVMLTASLLNCHPERFRNRFEWCSFLGLKLRQYESGSIERPRKLSKRGGGEFRRLLYLKVMSDLRYNREPMRSYFEKKKVEGKHGRMAMIACMRRMAKWFWAQERDLRQNLNTCKKTPLAGEK